MLDNSIQNAVDILSFISKLLNRPSIFAWGIVDWKIEKFIRAAKITKHSKYLVTDLISSCSWSIDLNIKSRTLLMTTKGFTFCSNAFFKTNLDWVIGPSVAQITKQTPSTISMILSTYPPKSWWPGVSTMLI